MHTSKLNISVSFNLESKVFKIVWYLIVIRQTTHVHYLSNWINLVRVFVESYCLILFIRGQLKQYSCMSALQPQQLPLSHIVDVTTKSDYFAIKVQFLFVSSVQCTMNTITWNKSNWYSSTFKLIVERKI